MTSLTENKLMYWIAGFISLLLIACVSISVHGREQDTPGDFYTGNILRTNPVNPVVESASNKTVEHFNLRIFETGEVFEEEDFAFRGGITKFAAEGFGELQGSKRVQAVDSQTMYSVNINEKFRTYTDPAAAEDEYMQAKSGFDVAGRAHSAVVGTEPNPGETGYMKQLVASNVDEKGEYLKYKGNVELENGRSRMNTSMAGASTDLDVVGESRVREKAKVETGGSRTGWWDIEWETDEDE